MTSTAAATHDDFGDPHPTITRDLFEQVCLRELSHGLRSRAAAWSLRVSDVTLELAGMTREEFTERVMASVEAALMHELGGFEFRTAPAPPIHAYMEQHRDADDENEGAESGALHDSREKLALVRAMRETLGLSAVTGRLYYEVLARAGVIEQIKEGPRRAQYGTRKLRKLVKTGWLVEDHAAGSWLTRGASPILFRLTPTGEDAMRAVDPHVLAHWESVVKGLLEDVELRNEVLRVRAAASKKMLTASL
jgi:hypothetical protein